MYEELISKFKDEEVLAFKKIVEEIEVKANAKYDQRYRFSLQQMQKTVEVLQLKNNELQEKILNKKSAREEVYRLLVRCKELEDEIDKLNFSFANCRRDLRSKIEKCNKLENRNKILKGLLNMLKLTKKKEKFAEAVIKLKIENKINSEKFEAILENDYKETLDFLKEKL